MEEVKLSALEKISKRIIHMTFPEANNYLNSLPREVVSAYTCYVLGKFWRSVDSKRLDYDLEHP